MGTLLLAAPCQLRPAFLTVPTFTVVTDPVELGLQFGKVNADLHANNPVDPYIASELYFQRSESELGFMA
jgi:hypothetical protein